MEEAVLEKGAGLENEMTQSEGVRPVTVHVLKLKEQYVRPIIECMMRYQVRYNDRGYQAGDLVRFVVVDRNGEPLTAANEAEYCTVDEIDLISQRYYRVDYVSTMEGLKSGYVVFSISICKRPLA